MYITMYQLGIGGINKIKNMYIYEGAIDASVNTYCKVKLVFLQKRL